MSKPNLLLYHAKWSLCSQMVRVALHEKGLEYDHKVIKLCDQHDEAENISEDFLKEINPTGVVPVLKINNEFVRDSAYIIERLDEYQGNNAINLWPLDPKKKETLRKWVYDTTIDESVKLGQSFGTSIPLFSTGLIEVLIKKLSLKTILNIIFNHPRRERKVVFVMMYFLSIKNKIGPLAYESFVNGLFEIENQLSDQGFLFDDFGHADINLMCCFNRLEELGLGPVLHMDTFPKISSYWKNLQARPSYKEGILNFVDHEQTIEEAFPDKFNPHLANLVAKVHNRKYT